MGTSQNGWSQLPQGQCSTFTLNGVTAWCHNADVATVLGRVFTRWNNEVEHCIITSSWRPISYTGGIGSDSNHTSGTAVDSGGGGRHPYERDLPPGQRYYSGFTPSQESRLIQIAAEFGVVTWGGADEHREPGGFQVGWRDPMHCEIKYGASARAVADAARKIRGGSAPSRSEPRSPIGGKKYVPLLVDGVAGKETYANLQRWAGSYVDGIWGINTAHAIQHKTGLNPGPWGKISVGRLQRAFGATQDGVWGRNTTMAIQKWFTSHPNG